MLNRTQAGNTHGAGQIGNIGQGNRRDPRRFNRPLSQSYGPAADGSDGNQDRHVDSLLLHLMNHGRNPLF